MFLQPIEESAGTVSASENPVGPSSTTNVAGHRDDPLPERIRLLVLLRGQGDRQLWIVGQGFDTEQDLALAGRDRQARRRRCVSGA
mgnify:CR=1 FL=1